MQSPSDSSHVAPEAGVQSTLPRPWEIEYSFNDVLYDWMNRAPWLAVSLAGHLLAFFILMAIPWDKFDRELPKPITGRVVPPPEEVFEEVKEKEIIEDLQEDEVVEPTFQDTEVDDVAETDETDFEVAEGDPLDFSDTDVDFSNMFNGELGIGGGGGDKYGNRGIGNGRRGKGGQGTAPALEAGLVWLRDHQDPAGYWDADGFSDQCGKLGGTVCDGPGNGAHDVGVTGLALLAFLGAGSTTNEGMYKDVVRRGALWLRQQQDPDTGLLGLASSRDFFYDHLLAALALCEVYYFSPSPLWERSAQDAVNYVSRARADYGAWRYDVPSLGDSDTSVTGWAVFVLTSAKEAGLVVDDAALDAALAWIDEVTDPATGRVGYETFGSLSSRTTANEHFPREAGEAMTAVGLLSRLFLGQQPDEEIVRKHVELLRRTPPEWDPEGFGCDMYYWYYGTYAMYQVGGSAWRAWNKAMTRAVVGSQRRQGDEAGSWDPVGPWGHAGGRVYSTALMTLCLEVYFRYGQLHGAR